MIFAQCLVDGGQKVIDICCLVLIGGNFIVILIYGGIVVIVDGVGVGIVGVVVIVAPYFCVMMNEK